MLDQVVIASKNRDKALEMERLISTFGIAASVAKGLDWPDIPEEGETLAENALLKATSVAEVTGLPAIADDTGLEVEALGGAPGVRTARFAGERATYEENVESLLSELEGVDHRRAVFRTVVALAFPGGPAVVAEGRLAGEITRAPRGAGGFGYDPVFDVGGTTLAEMSGGQKDELSHRRRALERLRDRMREGTED